MATDQTDKNGIEDLLPQLNSLATDGFTFAGFEGAGLTLVAVFKNPIAGKKRTATINEVRVDDVSIQR